MLMARYSQEVPPHRKCLKLAWRIMAWEIILCSILRAGALTRWHQWRIGLRSRRWLILQLLLTNSNINNISVSKLDITLILKKVRSLKIGHTELSMWMLSKIKSILLNTSQLMKHWWGKLIYGLTPLQGTYFQNTWPGKLTVALGLTRGPNSRIWWCLTIRSLFSCLRSGPWLAVASTATARRPVKESVKIHLFAGAKVLIIRSLAGTQPSLRCPWAWQAPPLIKRRQRSPNETSLGRIGPMLWS